jgi:hypothetical protein
LMCKSLDLLNRQLSIETYFDIFIMNVSAIRQM